MDKSSITLFSKSVIWLFLALLAVWFVPNNKASHLANDLFEDWKGGAVQSGSAPANVRLEPYRARGDGKADDTAAIQSAIDQNDHVYLPPGKYLIDPQIGLRMRTGTRLSGAGRSKSVLLAASGGGSVQNLVDYGGGSIVRRNFNVRGKNEYVAYVHLEDFSIILSHPNQAVTADGIQIGIDFRNVSRSLIERVHVGNTPPIGANFDKPSAHQFDSQGYGVVFGTIASSLPEYAGGELNVMRDSSVWGAYKAVVQDDEMLSPRSAAHGTVIERADIQGAQFLISQESIYARSFVWRDNVLQNVIPRPDGVDRAMVLRIEGKDAKVDGGYVEAGGLARYLIFLGADSSAVSVELLHTSCTNSPRNVNLGTKNVVNHVGGCIVSK